VWTHEGWLYLAMVIDLYSRKVPGWSTGKRLTSRLVCNALQMALWRRRPSKGQLVHQSVPGRAAHWPGLSPFAGEQRHRGEHESKS
jgi:putative transposase